MFTNTFLKINTISRLLTITQRNYRTRWNLVTEQQLEPLPLKEAPKPTGPSGWTTPLGGTESLPIQFERTASKNLPIYVKYFNGQARTVLRKFTGDPVLLVKHLRVLLGQDLRIRICNGRIELAGNHRQVLIPWLLRLGF